MFGIVRIIRPAIAIVNKLRIASLDFASEFGVADAHTVRLFGMRPQKRVTLYAPKAWNIAFTLDFSANKWVGFFLGVIRSRCTQSCFYVPLESLYN